MADQDVSTNADERRQEEIDRYRMARAQLEHEDNLVNQRLSWLIAAQSFLFTAFAILLNASPQARDQRFADKQLLLLKIIPVTAIGVGLLVYITILAGVLAMYNIRRLLHRRLSETAIVFLPPIQGEKSTLWLGHAGPILIPLVLIVVWLVIFAWG